MPISTRRGPFIYIAATRRTGSTMLAELLSGPPASFIFREPGFPRGRLRLKPETDKIVSAHGLDASALSDAMRAASPREAVRLFRETAVEGSHGIGQIGVKEIHHEGWERVSEEFPEMRVVVTTRDPRDIFLSLYHKREQLAARDAPWADPEALIDDLLAEFEHIRALMARHQHLVVKYEDLASSPSVLEEIRAFTSNDVAGVGMLGQTSRGNRKRHGHEVSASRVGLWRVEESQEGQTGARRVFEGMQAYAQSFDYPEG